MRQVAAASVVTLLTCLNLISHPCFAQATIDLDAGQIRGVLADGAWRYLGIPYAAAPVQDLRWAPPQPVQPWRGVRDGGQFAAACPQLPTPFSQGPTSEDCLYLNVHVPDGVNDARALPVLAWIHPGGLGMGAASDFDGTELARAARAVVVTFNYRLGALGFMRSAEMAQADSAGNFGLQDQQQALRWIQRHIARFGGDPQRVTLMGESGGAWSVCMHLVSPESAGLFQRAIMQSGPCATIPSQTSAQAQAHAESLARALNCPEGPGQLACLRTRGAGEIVQASPDVLELVRFAYPWAPVVDGRLLPGRPQDLVESGAFHKVPVLTGSTADEGRFFVGYAFHMKAGRAVTEDDYRAAATLVGGNALAGNLSRLLYPSSQHGGPGQALARLFTDAGFACPMLLDAARMSKHVPVYAYEFADVQAPAPADAFMDWRAYHTAELPYLFGKPVFVTEVAQGFSAPQRALSRQMMAYWGAFAASGVPQAAQQPSWPRFDATTSAILNLAPGQVGLQAKGAFSQSHRCGTWLPLFWLTGRS